MKIKLKIKYFALIGLVMLGCGTFIQADVPQWLYNTITNKTGFPVTVEVRWTNPDCEQTTGSEYKDKKLGKPCVRVRGSTYQLKPDQPVVIWKGVDAKTEPEFDKNSTNTGKPRELVNSTLGNAITVIPVLEKDPISPTYESVIIYSPKVKDYVVKIQYDRMTVEPVE